MSSAEFSVYGRDTPILRKAIVGAAALATSCVLSISTDSVAFAHDVVIDSNPVNGATIDAFPRSLSLVFSGEPKPGFNTVAVSDASNSKVLFTADPHIEGRNVSVDVPSDLNPGPGNYIWVFRLPRQTGMPPGVRLLLRWRETVLRGRRQARIRMTQLKRKILTELLGGYGLLLD